MKTFNQHQDFLKEESNKEFLVEGKLPADFEAFITVAYNGGLKKDSHTLKAAKLSPDAYKKHATAAKKIATTLHKTFKGKTMVHHGSGTGAMVGWWRGKNTPKTDNYIGKNRLSLKVHGGSRVMSASQSEAISTFTAAIKYMDSDTDQVQALINKVKRTMTEVVVPKDKMTWGDFRIAYKAEKTFKGAMKTIADKYTKAGKAHKRITADINSYFEDNPDFKMWFTYEAATGETKFGPDPYADANWVLKFDTSGKVHLLKKLSVGVSKPTDYVKKLSSGIGYRISWKTPTSKGQRSYSGFQGDIKDHVNLTMSSMINEELDIFENELLAEGLLDRGKAALGAVRDLYKRAKDFFKNLVNKILSYLQSLVGSGIGAVLDFLELTPKSIKVSNLEY